MSTTPTGLSLRGLPIDSKKLLWEILKGVGKEGRTVTYGELARRLNLKAGRRVVPERGPGLGKELGKLLRELCRWSYKEYGVLPGSTVVKQDGKPGKGYFKFLSSLGIPPTEQSWQSELNRFFNFCRGGNGNNTYADYPPDSGGHLPDKGFKEGGNEEGRGG
ncbi:MGMT family protein [Thermovibrio ammonificans]